MANNIDVKTATGSTVTLKTTDSGGVHTSHTKVDTLPADPLGANADAAIVTDTTGSINGKLRGLVKMQDERMPASLGQKAMTASLPVVIASDQSAVEVTGDVTVTGTVTAAASENHIGEVGGKLVVASATPVVSTSPAYTSGDAVGSVLSFTSATRVSAGSGVVQSVTVIDKGGQAANLDLLLFDSTVSVAPTDNTACTIADADLAKCVGAIPITGHHALADNSMSRSLNVGLGFKLTSGTTLYGILVSRGTPTYASTSDITVRLAITQN